MTYNYNPKTNKKRFALYAMCCACVLAGAVTFLFAAKIVALVCTAVGVWAACSIIKTVMRIQSARVVTFTEGFTVYTSHGDKINFTWQEVTHAGVVTAGEYEGTVFAYAEESDKIVQLPPVFCSFDVLKEELKTNTPWQEYALKDGETVTARLKTILGITTDGESDETEPTADTESPQ